MWSRKDREDFYDPIFANIGEQPILNKEIFAQGTDKDSETFGYQEPWAEYRYKPNRVSGKFRSKAKDPLDIWLWRFLLIFKKTLDEIKKIINPA